MPDLKDQPVLVIGLGGRGRAACELLRRAGANVVAADYADTKELRQIAGPLRATGVQVEPGAVTLPKKDFALAVVSPAVPAQSPLIEGLASFTAPVISELELGFQQVK